MAAVTYEDEETQEQFPNGDYYASDCHGASDSETNSDEPIASLAATPVPNARSRHVILQSTQSRHPPPPALRDGRRPCTPRPCKQVSLKLHSKPKFIVMYTLRLLCQFDQHVSYNLCLFG